MEKQKKYLSDQDKIRKATLYIKAKWMNYLRRYVKTVKGGDDSWGHSSPGDNFKSNFEYSSMPQMYKEIEAYKEKIYQRRKAINGSAYTPPKSETQAES